MILYVTGLFVNVLNENIRHGTYGRLHAANSGTRPLSRSRAALRCALPLPDCWTVMPHKGVGAPDPDGNLIPVAGQRVVT